MHDARFPPVWNRRRFTAGLTTSAAALLCAPLLSASRLQAQQPNGVGGLWNPLGFGAKGDGVTKDTVALQRTIDDCFRNGGGVVVLPPGSTFLSGTLTLRPHVELHLAGGSTLLASYDRDDFRELGSLLFAKDATDIHVSGTGLIEGNFQAFFPPKGPNGYTVPQPFLGPYDPLYGPEMRNPVDGRPRMILLVNCRNVLLEHFTIRNSPTWTIHPIGCEGLHISGISILNDLDVPNCDGIDIDHCREVRIEGCNIVAGDDCLVLKASRNFGQYGPCEGITITGCTLESSSAGIKIETEGAFPLRSAVISNCTVVRSNRGISFLNRDGATVEDMLFTDMTIETKMRPLMWWGSGEPVALSSVPRIADGPAGLVRGIQFVNLQCRGESGIYLRGTPGAPLRDISLRGIDLQIAKTTDIQGGFYDMRPGDAFGASGLDRRSIAGVFASQVDGLTLADVHVAWSGKIPEYFGSALELHQCSGSALAQVTGSAAQAHGSPAVFDRVTFAKPLDAPASLHTRR